MKEREDATASLPWNSFAGRKRLRHLPEVVRVDVDGNTVELKRKPAPPAPDPQQPAPDDGPQR